MADSGLPKGKGKPGIVARTEKEAPILRLGQFTVVFTPKVRIFVSLVALGALASIEQPFLSEFDQTRDIVSLWYSRLWLFGLCVIVALAFLLVLGQLIRPRLAIPVSIIAAVVVFIGIDYCAPKPAPPGEPPTLSIHETSLIISRVHSRAMREPSGNTKVYRPIFQDLFHDWIIVLDPKGTVTQLVVTIQDQDKPLDTIRVIPMESAVVSELRPGWLSGFDEPTQTPDFYFRTVSIAG